MVISLHKISHKGNQKNNNPIIKFFVTKQSKEFGVTKVTKVTRVWSD